MRSLDELRTALARLEPQRLSARRRAAVAVVVHDTAPAPEILFIERAARHNDPWSGQMAFPGGRIDPGDADERAAAERETREEVGLDLSGAELLGRLHDVNAGIRVVAPLVLSAFVYRVAQAPPLTLNHEVQTALWVPTTTLLDPARHVGYRWGPAQMPGVLVGTPDRHVVWGLTFQLLTQLFGAIGLTLPPV